METTAARVVRGQKPVRHHHRRQIHGLMNEIGLAHKITDRASSQPRDFLQCGLMPPPARMSRSRGFARRPCQHPPNLPVVASRFRRWWTCWGQTAHRAHQNRHMDLANYQTRRRRQRLLASATSLVRRMDNRMAKPQPPPREGFRTNHRNRHYLAFHCTRQPKHPQDCKRLQSNRFFMTPPLKAEADSTPED